MLFETARHEALCPTSWDPVYVRETIRAIAAEVEHARLPEGHWPIHELDLDSDIDAPVTGFKNIYVGSAGVIWALWYLQNEDAVKLHFDPRSAIEHAASTYQSEPDTGELVPSFFLGEAGIQMVRWRLTGSNEAEDQLYRSIQKNIANPTNEALWAAPGTMIAAWHLWEKTGDGRWRTLFAENIEQLWRTWLPDPENEFFMWTQDLYGNVVQLLGAGHGFVGNIYPLLRGAALLDVPRREELFDRCVKTLRATGIFEDGGANWPQGIGTPRPGRTSTLMQWCHGAPGVITSLAGYPQNRSPELESMLLAGGEAIWMAGPVAKGFGLCHGTAGNGYAFLKLYRRSGNSLWLDRARAFAMHAIAQRDGGQKQYGQGRYTLWTGDLGLAVYLWHCLSGADGLPAFDILG